MKASKDAGEAYNEKMKKKDKVTREARMKEELLHFQDVKLPELEEKLWLKNLDEDFKMRGFYKRDIDFAKRKECQTTLYDILKPNPRKDALQKKKQQLEKELLSMDTSEEVSLSDRLKKRRYEEAFGNKNVPVKKKVPVPRPEPKKLKMKQPSLDSFFKKN